MNPYWPVGRSWTSRRGLTVSVDGSPSQIFVRGRCSAFPPRLTLGTHDTTLAQAACCLRRSPARVVLILGERWTLRVDLVW